MENRIGQYRDGVGAYVGDVLDDLYFVVSRRHCKIGRSRNARKRLTGLQIGNHDQLELLLLLPRMGWQEGVWHEAFGHLKVRGEWFERTLGLKRAIEAARRGEEWIATLEPPALFEAEDAPALDAKWLEDKSPENVRLHAWRSYIADYEEEEREAMWLLHPEVLAANDPDILAEIDRLSPTPPPETE